MTRCLAAGRRSVPDFSRFRNELFGLIHAHSACYFLGMENCHRHPRGPLGTGGLRFDQKTVFDGTKLPLVVVGVENHDIWYRIAFS
jgi:hypothetical protein